MALLKYSLIRLATFCVVFAACMFLQLGRFTLPFAVLVGLLVSWAVAYLFFNRLRLAAGEQLAAIFSGRRSTGARQQADADAEDALAEQYHRETGRTDEDAASDASRGTAHDAGQDAGHDDRDAPRGTDRG